MSDKRLFNEVDGRSSQIRKGAGIVILMIVTLSGLLSILNPSFAFTNSALITLLWVGLLYIATAKDSEKIDNLKKKLEDFSADSAKNSNHS